MIDPHPLSRMIVGFDFSSDALLSGPPLSLQSGLTVVYGVNGAGKSRLLRGIRAALTGIATDASVSMIIAADPSIPESGPILNTLALAIDGSIGRSFDSSHAIGGERRLASGTAQTIIEQHIRELIGDEDPVLLQEVLRTRYFLVVPTGTAARPSWDAWPVADTRLPAASIALEIVNAAREAFENSNVDDEDAFEQAEQRWNDAVRSQAIIATSQNALIPRRSDRSWDPGPFHPYGLGFQTAEWYHGIELAGPHVSFGTEFVDLEEDAVAATNRYLKTIADRLLRQIAVPEIGMHVQTIEEIVRAEGLPDSTRPPFDRHGNATEVKADIAEFAELTISRIAAELGASATTFLHEILPDTPAVILHVTPPPLRSIADPFVWRVGPVGLDGLSRAERAWTQRSILLALHSHRRRLVGDTIPTLAVLDEPESALHRSAEADMSQSLVRHSAARGDASFPHAIVATHSPDLLDSTAPHVHLVEIKRAAGGYRRSLVRPLDLTSRQALGELGLTPSDLLRWTRVFLFVEGVHDRILLRAFLGDRLDRARVEILPIDGAKNLRKSWESDILFKFTNAHVAAVLDNTRYDDFLEVWTHALAISNDQTNTRAAEYVATHIDKSGETGALRKWLANAFTHEQQHRVHPLALSHPDILEYLPVQEFVPEAKSWDELHQIRRQSDPTVTDETGRFKEWVSSRYGTDFGAAAVEAAAAAVASRIPIPDEFLDLMTALERISAMPDGH